MKYILLSGIALGVFLGGGVFAQEVHQDLKETVRAEVLEIISESEREIIGTDTTATVQNVRAYVRSGTKEGETVVFENDVSELSVGDSIYLNRLETIAGEEYYMLKDFDRRVPLALLVGVFLIVLFLIAGVQGLRAFGSLLASIALIVFGLVPALLAGYDPVIASVLIAGVILACAIFATHGFTVRSTVAFLGTLGAVVCTGILATLFVHVSRLTGFASDASIYLNFSTQGSLDFSGLLLGGIMIGVLGVLDDVAITQASVVEELARANPSFSFFELYRRALRVGRDHIGSLVNTLALAYVGVSLPLILLFARTDSGIGMILNQEVVASEIVRSLVGSIGLMLAVPLTTLIAAYWISKHGVGKSDSSPSTHHHFVQ